MPGPVWGARANQWCRGQSIVPGPINGARANQWYRGQSMVQGSVNCTRASQWCQRQSVVPEPISGAGASQWCRGHSILRATPGMQPNYLCDSMCYALLPEGNRSALVYQYRNCSTSLVNQGLARSAGRVTERHGVPCWLDLASCGSIWRPRRPPGRPGRPTVRPTRLPEAWAGRFGGPDDRSGAWLARLGC